MKMYTVTLQLKPTGHTYTSTMLACSMSQAMTQALHTKANALMVEPDMLRVIHATTLNNFKQF